MLRVVARTIRSPSEPLRPPVLHSVTMPFGNRFMNTITLLSSLLHACSD